MSLKTNEEEILNLRHLLRGYDGQNPTTTGADTIADILAKFPCDCYGTVEILRDASIPGATCDCGRKEGTQVRWEIGRCLVADERYNQIKLAEEAIVAVEEVL